MQNSDGDVSNKEIFQLLQNVMKKSETIENQTKKNATELKEEIRNIKNELKQELETVKRENEEIKSENLILKKRLIKAERKLKKYNLVLYGINEEENNIQEVEGILNVINENLGVNCHFTDLRDYYRIGQSTSGKIRPLVIEVLNYQLKVEILKNTKKLKGTRIFITNDLILDDYLEQKVLWENLKIARGNNLQAKIKKNTLIVENRTYTHEELKNNPLRKYRENPNDVNSHTVENQEIETQNTPGTKELRSEKEKTPIPSFNKEPTSPTPTFNKRKEQPTSSESQIKRSARIQKISTKHPF